MKASEARQLTNKNGISLTDALKKIKDQANQGRSCFVFDNMSPDIIQRLFALEYTISKFRYPIVVDLIKIEW